VLVNGEDPDVIDGNDVSDVNIVLVRLSAEPFVPLNKDIIPPPGDTRFNMRSLTQVCLMSTLANKFDGEYPTGTLMVASMYGPEPSGIIQLTVG
jgi:hypothetical protein